MKMRKTFQKKIVWSNRIDQKILQDWHKNHRYQPKRLNYRKDIDNVFEIIPIDYITLRIKHVMWAVVKTQNRLWNIEDIKIKDVVTFQSFLHKKTMNKMKAIDLDNLDQFSILPVVFNIGNKFCIYDGNHRLATAKLSGRTSLKMNVIKI